MPKHALVLDHLRDLRPISGKGYFSRGFTAEQSLLFPCLNGFVVTPPDNSPEKLFTEFYQGYESVRYDETPIFVTTDAIFHVYHLGRNRSERQSHS